MRARTSRAVGPRWAWLRWLALGVMLLALGGILVRQESAPERSEPLAGSSPSIVFVLVDTLRADYLGAYGFAGAISPHLDRLAKQSVVFEQAFSQAPWTKPSIASLFTSLHPEQHGVVAHEGRYGGQEHRDVRSAALPQRARTLAEVLRDHGYETAAFVANPWITRSLGFAQGFDIFDVERTGNDVAAQELLVRAEAWMAQRDPARPFFLYLHLMDVHGPYRASRPDHDALRAASVSGERRTLTQSELGKLPGYLVRDGGPLGDPRRLETWRIAYAAGVRSVDRAIGEFLSALEQRDQLENVLVLVTSDHGEELADHGGWGHGRSLYEEQIRVPLIVRLPGAIGAGRRVERVVSLIDLMPTLLPMAGARVPSAAVGEDLGPLLAGEPMDSLGVSFASGVKWRPNMKSVRTQTRKWIESPRPDSRLFFDIETDPLESTNLFKNDPGAADALAGSLADHRAHLALGQILPARARALDAATREKLEALGYLQPEASPAAGESDR